MEPNVPEEVICTDDVLNSLPADVNSPEELKAVSLVIISELFDTIFPLLVMLEAPSLTAPKDISLEASIKELLVISKVPLADVVPESTNKLAPSTVVLWTPVIVAVELNELLPDTDVEKKSFWNGLDKCTHELAPKNRKLLEFRENLQKKIDIWHKDKKGEKIDIKEYSNFLIKKGN